MATFISDRIDFHQDLEVVEIDFSNMSLATDKFIHAIYDEVESQLSATDRKWYFLRHYQNCRISQQAWSAFATRGKGLYLAYSLGTVRFGAPAETRAEIGVAAEYEKFDANLVGTRGEALALIQKLRAERDAAGIADLKPDRAAAAKAAFADRILFHPDIDVMEVDFSDLHFSDDAKVNAFYDELEQRCMETRRKWYFMINYGSCGIAPEAWNCFAHRGRRLNLGHSYGSVRYDVSEEAQREIARRSESENFDPNVCQTRDDAMQRIKAMQAKAKLRSEDDAANG